MKRRTFLKVGLGLAAALQNRFSSAAGAASLDDAAAVLSKAVDSGEVASATLHVAGPRGSISRSFGKASSENAMFLLGSISKPICITALMSLFDQDKFSLDDPLKKFLPAFTGGGRERVTMRHLLTHSSGLADQLPENGELRKKHAGLAEFAEHAVRMPLSFAAGSRYQYSNMGVLLATQVAEKLGGVGIAELVDRAVFGPLGMQHSAVGLGHFKLEEMTPCQMEHAAPEAGGGDPAAKDWDWNSPYWRKLGAPWGGVHASAPDLARFLAEFLHAQGKAVKPPTAKLMISNQNAPGVKPRGLGFDIDATSGSRGCSEQTFGHTGSTGTLLWADLQTQTICVVLTSLPGAAVRPHPRDLAGHAVAESSRV